MKNDLTSTLATFMTKYMTGPITEWDNEEKEFKKLTCSDSEGLGAWIEKFELPVLAELLRMPDKYFYEKFKGLKSFDREKRIEFAKKLEAHGKICPRCSVKILMDKKWEAIVDESMARFRDNEKRMSKRESTPNSKHAVRRQINSTIAVI
ncbi:MAG TPA: hypothetical protein VGO50_04810 [Pyrinomonadaceae bacterium]|jgi:hypothetical protein|nr:hypothetical protein [Pyrinomonadaceae bacterium]